MKFKTEVSLLTAAILLFVFSVFFYTYQIGGSVAFTETLASYPYRSLGLAFVGFGSALMATAAFSYSKRSKTIIEISPKQT